MQFVHRQNLLLARVLGHLATIFPYPRTIFGMVYENLRSK